MSNTILIIFVLLYLGAPAVRRRAGSRERNPLWRFPPQTFSRRALILGALFSWHSFALARKLFLQANAFRARTYHCAGRDRPLAQRRAGECAASASQFTARFARLHRGRLRSAWHVIAMTSMVIGAVAAIRSCGETEEPPAKTQ